MFEKLKNAFGPFIKHCSAVFWTPKSRKSDVMGAPATKRSKTRVLQERLAVEQFSVRMNFSHGMLNGLTEASLSP